MVNEWLASLFRRLQMRRRMTPVTDIPIDATLQSPEPDPPQFEVNIAENVDFQVRGLEIDGSIRLDPISLKNPVSAAENTDKLSLTEDPKFFEPEGAEENMESFAQECWMICITVIHCPD